MRRESSAARNGRAHHAAPPISPAKWQKRKRAPSDGATSSLRNEPTTATPWSLSRDGRIRQPLAIASLERWRRWESNPKRRDTLTLRGHSVFSRIAITVTEPDLLLQYPAVPSNAPACPARPKHVPALRARPSSVGSSSHAGKASSNLAGVTAIREPGFGRASSIAERNRAWRFHLCLGGCRSCEDG